MKLSRRVALVAVVTAISLAGLADVAHAHYVYRKAVVYGSDTHCTGARAETSHGGGGGYSKSDVYSWYAFEFVGTGRHDCFSDWSRPPGWMETRFVLFKWTGSNWGACWISNTYRNGTSTHQYAIYKNFGKTAPCGAGHYSTDAYSYVYNNGWFGGVINSGTHALPDTADVDTPKPPDKLPPIVGV